MAAPSFFLGRFPRLGRLLVSLGFGPGGGAVETNIVPCVHITAPVGVVETAIADPAGVVATEIGAPVGALATAIGAPAGLVATAITLEEC